MLAIFLACQKERKLPPKYDCNRPAPIPDSLIIDSAAQARFYYKTGSWWVFREQKSGLLDTLFLKTDSFRTFKALDDCEFLTSLQDQALMHFYSSHFAKSFSLTVFGDKHGLNLQEKDSADILYNHPVKYPFNTDTLVNGFVTAAGNFDKVVKLNIYASLLSDSSANARQLWYFAPQAGLIQREIPQNGQTWKLVAYHVQQ